MVERAQSETQTNTRNGRPSVTMVSVEEWNRKAARKGTFAEFLLSLPPVGTEGSDERPGNAPRDLGL